MSAANSRTAEALELMMQTEGWQEYVKFLAMEERRLEGVLFGTTSGDDALACVASLRTLRAMKSWPVNMATMRKERGEG